MTLDNMFEIALKGFHHPDTVFTECKKHYPEIINHSSNEVLKIGTDDQQIEQRNSLQLDLQFFSQHPYLPLESICNNLKNYELRHDSQKKLMDSVNQLMGLEHSSAAAGIFMYGDTGTGKTHMSIALAKEFMRGGFETYFVSPTSTSYISSYEKQFGPNQVWIIDDVNSSHSWQVQLFRKVVLNAHEKGGRVFATSNTPYKMLIDRSFNSVTKEEQPRFMSRTQGMIVPIHIQGEDQRHTKAWYTPPKDEKRMMH